MTTDAEPRDYHIRNSEKCFRFKPEALDNHAPPRKGIYELVSFDENQNPQVLYVGAAFDKTIFECLTGHQNGDIQPTAKDLFTKHPNLYFDFLTEMHNTKTAEDAQDIYWWLVQKYKPLYNDINSIKPSEREGAINVTELD